MALEIITTIKDTESRAEEIKKQAIIEGKELLKVLEKQYSEDYEVKSAEAGENAIKIAISFEGEANKEKLKMKADMEQNIERIKKDSTANMDAAIKYILGRID